MSDDELIEMRQAPPKPMPNIYAVGRVSEGETRAFIAVSWIVSLVLAFLIGGALL